MPELPDVEVFKRYVDSTSLHQEVQRVRVLEPDLLKGVSAQALGQHLKGKRFTGTHRHGKFLFIRADEDGWLLMHFGMTGKLEYGHWHGEPPKYTGAMIEFEDQAGLAYVAPRKLGRIGWTDDPDAFARDQDLGPNADALSLSQFRELADGRKGAVKAWLMDQTAMAGIGNVYSDEILFRAGIHPGSQVRNLDKDRIAHLHRAMGQVLAQAIKAQADPEKMPKSFLLPNRKEGAPCPGCGGKLERTTAAGRSSYYCPKCQPKV